MYPIAVQIQDTLMLAASVPVSNVPGTIDSSYSKAFVALPVRRPGVADEQVVQAIPALPPVLQPSQTGSHPFAIRRISWAHRDCPIFVAVVIRNLLETTPSDPTIIELIGPVLPDRKPHRPTTNSNEGIPA